MWQYWLCAKTNNLLYWSVHCLVFKHDVPLQHDKQLVWFHAAVDLIEISCWHLADTEVNNKYTSAQQRRRNALLFGLHYIRCLTSLIHGFTSVTPLLICIQPAANDAHSAWRWRRVHWYSARWVLRLYSPQNILKQPPPTPPILIPGSQHHQHWGGGCWKMIHTCCAGTWASLFMIGGKQHYHWPFRTNTALLHVIAGDHVKAQQKVNKVVFYSTCDTTTARQRRVWLHLHKHTSGEGGLGWEVEGSCFKPWCRQMWMVSC